MLDWTGKKVGNYQVLRTIGHGGFAEVYLGQHAYLQTYGAIKILQSRLAQNDLATFLTEARTVANLTHPHIVRVLEFGEEKQTPYLVMDYCPNGSLRQRHPKGTRVSLPECVEYVKQVASALQYAHERRIIHRDVKPENILIGRDGTVLLADFGISTISQSSRYSGQQDLGGTIAYAAPEQMQGRATAASDQYALAITVYELLSGEYPFKGSFPEIASQHLLAPVPSIRALVPSVPEQVEMVLRQALAKDPTQRFPTVLAFAQSLEQAASGQGTGSTTIRRDQQEYVPTFRPQGATTITSNMPHLSGSLPQQTMPANTFTNPAMPYVPPPPPPSFAYMQNPGIPPRKKSGYPAIISFLVVLVLILGGVSTWALTHQNGSSGTNINGQQSVSTTGKSTSGGTQDNNTAPTQVPVVVKKVGAQTITKNLRLTTNDDDPIALSIKTITIDTDKGNMTWDLSFHNISGQGYAIYFNDFHLEGTVDGQQESYAATGPVMQGYTSPIGVLTDGLAAGQTVDTPVVFSFVPLTNTQYTLHAWILNDGNTYVSIKFDPTQFTFS